MGTDYQLNDNDWEKQNVPGEKTYPSATLSARNPTWTRLKVNSGLHGDSWLTST